MYYVQHYVQHMVTHQQSGVPPWDLALSVWLLQIGQEPMERIRPFTMIRNGLDRGVQGDGGGRRPWVAGWGIGGWLNKNVTCLRIQGLKVYRTTRPSGRKKHF